VFNAHFKRCRTVYFFVNYHCILIMVKITGKDGSHLPLSRNSDRRFLFDDVIRYGVKDLQGASEYNREYCVCR